MIWLGALSLAIWLGLWAPGFWRCSQRDDRVDLPEPPVWPDVVAAIPARHRPRYQPLQQLQPVTVVLSWAWGKVSS